MDNLTATLMIVGGVAAFLAVQILLLSLLKKNRAALVVVAVVFFVLGIWLCVRISGGKLSALGDVVGLAGIFFFAVPMLFASGRAGDFVLAMKVVFAKKPAQIKELKAARDALGLLEKLVIFGSVAVFLIGLTSIFNYLADYSAIFPNLAIALLPLLYAVILCSAIACVRSVIDSKLADEEEI